jgi:hypothetical protein
VQAAELVLAADEVGVGAEGFGVDEEGFVVEGGLGGLVVVDGWLGGAVWEVAWGRSFGEGGESWLFGSGVLVRRRGAEAERDSGCWAWASRRDGWSCADALSLLLWATRRKCKTNQRVLLEAEF